MEISKMVAKNSLKIETASEFHCLLGHFIFQILQFKVFTIQINSKKYIQIMYLDCITNRLTWYF